jgi:multisubunit Na+/H+ antiporter MnhE subunit
MSTIFFAILVGVAWMGLTAEIGWQAFAVGAAGGLVIRRLEGARAGRPFGPLCALRLVWLGARLVGVFLWELVVANLEQLRIVLAPKIDVHPGWIRFRSELESPPARALLGAMISLTPGSLTYEDSAAEDGTWTVSLHVLDLRDEERLVARIRARFEKPLRTMESL